MAFYWQKNGAQTKYCYNGDNYHLDHGRNSAVLGRFGFGWPVWKKSGRGGRTTGGQGSRKLAARRHFEPTQDADRKEGNVKAIGKREIVVPTSVLEAVVSRDRVDEPPHSFYKYPARFSPVFAREVIKAFTQKGDTVINPFCGGGTSLVEAISLGRR